MERLSKFIARCGIASRRKSEDFIKDGLVTVNGKVVDTLGTKIDAEGDAIKIGSKLLKLPPKKYFLFNKPLGVITTKKDEKNRKTILDFLPPKHKDLHPVGRLDKDTTGLLILTNDGEFTNFLAHPRHKVKKTYRVFVKGIVRKETVAKLEKGIFLNDGKTLPVEILTNKKKKGGSVLKLRLAEGRKRQIRRMLTSVGHEVMELERIQIGTLFIGTIKSGGYRPLTEKELAQLKGERPKRNTKAKSKKIKGKSRLLVKAHKDSLKS